MRFDHKVTTPAYLPRYASLGIFLNQYGATPNLKVGWEITVFDDARNLLLLIFELGPGFGIAFPTGVKQFWEHSALGGLGYRWGREKGFQWGFTLGGGAVLEGAIYDPPLGDALPRRRGGREEWVYGYVEGRLFAGWDFGPIIAALAFGYGSSLNQSEKFPSTFWVGGFNLGVYLNWR
jgi:hypothetical protein